jgi:hypothetical protein
MKLISEAAIDDQFTVHIGKIQKAIAELEKLAPKFKENGTAPVRSQRMALEVAAEDLNKLKTIMFQ